MFNRHIRLPENEVVFEADTLKHGSVGAFWDREEVGVERLLGRKIEATTDVNKLLDGDVHLLDKLSIKFEVDEEKDGGPYALAILMFIGDMRGHPSKAKEVHIALTGGDPSVLAKGALLFGLEVRIPKIYIRPRSTAVSLDVVCTIYTDLGEVEFTLYADVTPEGNPTYELESINETPASNRYHIVRVENCIPIITTTLGQAMFDLEQLWDRKSNSDQLRTLVHIVENL